MSLVFTGDCPLRNATHFEPLCKDTPTSDPMKQEGVQCFQVYIACRFYIVEILTHFIFDALYQSICIDLSNKRTVSMAPTSHVDYRGPRV